MTALKDVTMNKLTIKLSTLSIALLSAMGVVSLQAQAELTESVAQAVTDGKTTINLRYRYEQVDQDGMSEEATASTLKTRLSWQSGQAGSFNAKIEVDDVTTIGGDDYNSTANGNTQYPVVADPQGTDINQAYLQYKQDNLKVTAGRQRVVHNDQRFVGGVAWRQNEQTYDGYRVQYKASDALKVDYSYIFNVNRIFGPSGAKADLHGNVHLFNANYAIDKAHKLAFFGYSMEFDNAAAASNTTYGLRYNGKFDVINVMASYAMQKDAGQHPVDYSADYFAVELGTKLGSVNLGVGYENLGADNGVGFTTPLATLHKFQGFADKFLGTPGSGVEDFYVKASTKIDKLTLKAIWHNLQASEGSADYGTELDLVAVYPFSKQIKGVLKYASYSADGVSVDTDKLWFMVNVKF